MVEEQVDPAMEEDAIQEHMSRLLVLEHSSNGRNASCIPQVTISLHECSLESGLT